MSSSLRIIITGLIAQYPLGGVAWDYLQFAVGLARMGHDVYYIEDTGQWPYDPRTGGTGVSAEYNATYLAEVMGRFGLADRWAYRFEKGAQWFGMSGEKRAQIVRTSDLLINVSGSLARPGDYRQVARLAYIDSDPVFTQIKLARDQLHFKALIDSHDVHFSFGETIGTQLPDTGHTWLPTRQPILLDEWETSEAPSRPLTTIMNWSSYGVVEYKGVTYGQKDVEFMKFMDLPERIFPVRVEIAMNAAGKNTRAPLDLLQRKGWSFVSPDKVAGSLEAYRRFIQTSTAEWSVAKNGYVQGNAGWFSCRSACYLAAGRPVIVEDTGFRNVLPNGEGLLAFSTLDEAVDAVRAVESDLVRHSSAARQIARGYFAAEDVLASLIERAFKTPAGPTIADGSHR